MMNVLVQHIAQQADQVCDSFNDGARAWKQGKIEPTDISFPTNIEGVSLRIRPQEIKDGEPLYTLSFLPSSRVLYSLVTAPEEQLASLFETEIG